MASKKNSTADRGSSKIDAAYRSSAMANRKRKGSSNENSLNSDGSFEINEEGNRSGSTIRDDVSWEAMAFG